MDQANDWKTELRGDRLAVFLDVDGTLLDFEDRPEDVAADDALRDLLGHLRAATGGALALISGRTIADLDRIMAPLVFAAGGTHGAEMRWPDGRVAIAAVDALAHVRPAFRAFVDERPGLILEDKGAALTVHFRLAPDLEDEVVRALEGFARDHDLMVQHGKMVAEIKSATSSKGAAIRHFMETPPFAERQPLFIGDDLTDEHGFAGVAALGGISVKVGAGKTIAHHRLADVAEVRALLGRIR